MTFTEILYELSEGIATISLNRPDRNNAWTPTIEAELRLAFAAAAGDADAAVIVLTGVGKHFCVGADSAQLARRSTGIEAIPNAHIPARLAFIRETGKPVIAAINGSVAGVGLSAALYCDIRYVSDQAKISTAFARRGLIAEDGIAWILNRLIGSMHTLDLLLSGRTITAVEAARIGLANLVPQESFRQFVRNAGLELANFSSPRSMRIIKQQILAAQEQSFAEAIALAEVELAECRSTEDFREGVAHFMEKRAPKFPRG